MAGATARERAELVRLLRELGPDSPTLCEGWDTRRMAAHLVTRETRPDALAGILIRRFAGHTAALEEATARRIGYPELVDRIAAGPPLGRTLVGLPLLQSPANLHEFFVHHEDVRRAQAGWMPRELPASEVAGLWRRLVVLAPVLFAGLRGVRLVLATTDGRRHATGSGSEQVTLTGPVPELFLYAFGRRSAAAVEISGSRTGAAQLAAADLRM